MKGVLSLVAAVSATMFVATSANAVSVNRYTSLVIFGDSFSDPGNLWEFTAGAFPPNPPYPNRQFTNQDVWAVQVAEEFEAAGQTVVNAAFGGARASENGDEVPDLVSQIGLVDFFVEPEDLGERPVFLGFIGGNDGLDVVGTGTDIEVRAAATLAAETTIGSIGLYSFGVGVPDVAFINLPDLGVAPRFSGNPAASAQGSLYTNTFNAVLASGASALRGLGFNVTEVDFNGLANRILSNPNDFGLTDVEAPCVIPGTRICTPDEATTLAFFDDIHPNSVVHEQLAEAVSEQIAPVPVPTPLALLLGGIGALFLLRGLQAKPMA